MEARLTPREENLIKLAQQKGFITLEDACILYKKREYAKATLKRLVILKKLKESEILGQFKPK